MIDLNDWLTPAEATEIMRKQDEAIYLMRAALEKLKSNSVARDALKAADEVLK